MATGDIYVIGDIHGRLDLLWAALRVVADHSTVQAPRLVLLGDYVDRGPDSRRVVELVMALQEDPRVVCLKGNHEALMVKALTDGSTEDFQRWRAAGGDATIRSYGAMDHESAETNVPKAHLRWMASLPLTSGDGHRIYVHAGLMPGVPLEDQREETCLWIKERFLRARPQQFDMHVVHGHTPVWAGKPDAATPELLAHRTNLDTGAYMTDALAIGVFAEAIDGGPVEVLTVSCAAGGSASVSTVRPAAPRPSVATPRPWLKRLFGA